MVAAVFPSTPWLTPTRVNCSFGIASSASPVGNNRGKLTNSSSGLKQKIDPLILLIFALVDHVDMNKPISNSSIVTNFTISWFRVFLKVIFRTISKDPILIIDIDRICVPVRDRTFVCISISSLLSITIIYFGDLSLFNFSPNLPQI